ncbi:ornithine carbamoyltransferase [Helicobacter enhydrae]|uniref:Ornithine carbamoyltransferase n=1 Tax=Helicobacter enhydrae TaxID=222136 RepID=A0A1B1U4C1_9HELI|nr:ornithine carbamoyltransferase [Helicobacter enhydrae]ANV97555.1 ornithine carbamoyltransferase [Helicobacter enhydrae]
MKHFLSLKDFEKNEILEMIALAQSIKSDFQAKRPTPLLKNQILAMIFEKNSTRTRVSFESGIYQLGGTGIFLSSNDIQLSRGEPIKDTARVVGSMVDMVMIRTFAHSRLEEFAHYSPVPVINGLSDSFHPVQLMADYLTMLECGFDLENNKPKVAYIGDGNNIAHSWLMLASKLGFDLNIATPPGYEVDAEILSLAQQFASKSQANISITNNPQEAVEHCNVVTTDTWSSMGQESEKQIRKQAFQGFMVDTQLMQLASQDAIFLHCLPAYRGEEVSDEVLESQASKVFLEAENRLHAQKGIMVYLANNTKDNNV